MSLTDADWELLHRDVDGETTPYERAELRRRLAAEPDLRAQHEALLDLAGRLGGLSLVDPPEGLRWTILHAVRQAAARRGGESPWGLALLARRPAFALAAALALGIGAGLSLSGLLGEGRWSAVDESSVVGTALLGGHPDLPVADRVRLEGAGLRAEAVARKAAGVVVVEVVIERPRTAALFVESSGSGLSPRGFLAPDGLPAAGAVLEAGGAYFADALPGRYRLILAPASEGSGELRIRLQSPDGRVDGTLQVGPVSAPARPETRNR